MPEGLCTLPYKNFDFLVGEVFLTWYQDKKVFHGFGTKAQVISQVCVRGGFIPLQVFMEFLLCVQHRFKHQG